MTTWGGFRLRSRRLAVLATALAAAGLDVAADPRLEGVDLLPFLTGKRSGSPHELLCWRFGQQMALLAGLDHCDSDSAHVYVALRSQAYR